jgi:hypothetical protein
VLRAALGGVAGAVSLAACDSPRQAGQKQSPDPLNPFYRETAALLDRYEATIAAQPRLAERLGPPRDAHRAHLQALAREIGPGLDGPSATASASGGTPSDEAAALAALLAAEKDASAAARAACLSAPSYRAALLGSIAAARASHVAVLS